MARFKVTVAVNNFSSIIHSATKTVPFANVEHCNTEQNNQLSAAENQSWQQNAECFGQHKRTPHITEMSLGTMTVSATKF